MFPGPAGRGGEGERGPATPPGSASEGPAGAGGTGPAEGLTGGAADPHPPEDQPRNTTGGSPVNCSRRLNLAGREAPNNPTVWSPQIASLQSEHEEQEQRICQFEEELVQAREELLALQEESRRLQEKVQAAQEQLTPLKESVHDSFVQVAQVGLVPPGR